MTHEQTQYAYMEWLCPYEAKTSPQEAIGEAIAHFRSKHGRLPERVFVPVGWAGVVSPVEGVTVEAASNLRPRLVWVGPV